MNIDSNTVALVTGGASGLGEATIRALVSAGSKAVIADLNAERGQGLADELGEGVVFAATNVADADQVRAAISAAQRLGDLRIAVSCAGIGPAAKVVGRDGSPHDLDLYRKVIEVNLIGTFNVLRLAAAAMAGNEPNDDGERGVVVNTASVAAFEGQIGQAAYSSSKGGVVGLTLPAARDLMKTGVRVLTIAPGTFDTPLLAGMPENVREALAAGIPFPRRLGQPSEYGALVRHIVENAYLNGEVIRLDGALRMPPR
ncbi:MAG: 3-hydroxyacyl-CoA dehydrogenase [Thermoanaerobaculia bacterium]|nr:3-hydroxyacyl-CoA dehydrogenase [Thermoanaerobaculia bacterium]